MPLLMVSSNASPVEVACQISNGANSTTTNSGYIGTTTSNDFVLMSPNTRRMTVKASGLIGIGTSSPSVYLHVASNSPYTWNPLNNVGITVYRLRTDSRVTETAGGVAVPYTLTIMLALVSLFEYVPIIVNSFSLALILSSSLEVDTPLVPE
jgi:hypothetical protein